MHATHGAVCIPSRAGAALGRSNPPKTRMRGQCQIMVPKETLKERRFTHVEAFHPHQRSCGLGRESIVSQNSIQTNDSTPSAYW